MFPAVGWVTASAKAVATAASTALPPSRSTAPPTSEAMVLWEMTIAFLARTGSAAAKTSVPAHVATRSPSAARWRICVMARWGQVVILDVDPNSRPDPNPFLLSVADGRPNFLQQILPQIFRAGEDGVRLPAVVQHVGVDDVGLVQVQPAARQVLQPQVAVAVDLRVGQPRREVRRAVRRRSRRGRPPSSCRSRAATAPPARTRGA